ncbi:hypothetical protein SAY86_018228 [Trapa natans]|uniref:Phosphatidate cytidylyltransferase, mitochondrial n=1 Tax=Trapa natans TaxID=22666 RepID=A0AAN7R0T7_TRANT|nr:hypothetical protein SAY86_018228 [Trapa natans]
MEDDKKAELAGFLKVIPPVEFCCVYGSSLHPNNQNKTSTMVDFILGVPNPIQWHSQNLKLNRDHYASWIARIGGEKLITRIAEDIGVGVHFNPFIDWNDKVLKYGVVQTHNLMKDVLSWNRFYLSGRLQKPVHMLVDNLAIGNANSSNLRAAVSTALLLLPPQFSEEELFFKICSLSYMGDLRMLFAEDRHKVNNIVQGQFNLFHSMYGPFLEEYERKNLIRFSSSSGQKAIMVQDTDLLATGALVSSLPSAIKSYLTIKLGEKKTFSEFGHVVHEITIESREEAARCIQRILRRTVMVSSARQAVSGFLASGGLIAARYLAKKMSKAWKSWT